MPMTTSTAQPAGAALFSRIVQMPHDPILISMEQFAADPRRFKVNLGVGMYYDESGRIPLLQAVRAAEEMLAARPVPWGYLPVEGLPDFRRAAAELLFGTSSPALQEGRIATVQSLGGTGALRVGADLLFQLRPDAQSKPVVALSDPTWANHPAIFEAAGFEIVTYPYVDPATSDLDFNGMLAAIAQLAPGTVVLLHACCHNPSGVDLNDAEWRRLTAVLIERRLVPFLDIAYQGFGSGIEADSYPVRLMAESGLPLFVALSFSKSFALYGERIGALCVVTGRPDDAIRLTEQTKSIGRGSYSTPPTHGAAVVATVLNRPDLRALWISELDAMRTRIGVMRHKLVDLLAGHNGRDFSHLVKQRGLFSFSGLSPAQVEKLKLDHAIYAVENGRLCMAALNDGNVERVAEAIRQVVDVGQPLLDAHHEARE